MSQCRQINHIHHEDCLTSLTSLGNKCPLCYHDRQYQNSMVEVQVHASNVEDLRESNQGICNKYAMQLLQLVQQCIPSQPVQQPMQPVQQPIQPVQQPIQPVQPQIQRFQQPIQHVQQPIQHVQQPIQHVQQPIQPVQSVQQPIQPVQRHIQSVQRHIQPVQRHIQPVHPRLHSNHSAFSKRTLEWGVVSHKSKRARHQQSFSTLSVPGFRNTRKHTHEPLPYRSLRTSNVSVQNPLHPPPLTILALLSESNPSSRAKCNSMCQVE